jgi:tRNA A-37 threonylcarbamoyl transferase component Bud32
MDYQSFRNIYNSKKIIGKGVKGIVKEWCLNNCYDKMCNDCNKHVIKCINEIDIEIQQVLKIFNLTKHTDIFPKLLRCYRYNTQIYLIMERIGYQIEYKKFSIETLIKNIIDKVFTMHNLNICHKDLNTRNIMICNDNITFLDVDSCSFINSDNDVIQDLTTLFGSVMSKLTESKSIQKTTSSTSKSQIYKRHISSLYLQGIKDKYSSEIYNKCNLMLN